MRTAPTEFTIFVPGPGTRLGIKPGSAIVASIDQIGQEQVLIHYEGNLYNCENLRLFEERLMNAADRQATRYPTIACMKVNRDDLIVVGRYDLPTRTILEISNQPELDDWLS